MKEYGGYIEFEHFSGSEYHPEAVALNCGRNCLAYLIVSRNIKKISLPYFLCSSVRETCEKYPVEVSFYHLDKCFRPVLSGERTDDQYIYIVNYYGLLTKQDILLFKEKYGNIIVDNSHAFFQKAVPGVDTHYNCRKYFGVADGAYLYTDSEYRGNLETDISYPRMNYLLGRFEKGANAFYEEYVSNNKIFREEPLKWMSALTHNLLRPIDYDKVKVTREENFKTLQKGLADSNLLDIQILEGPYAYPYMIQDAECVRKELIKRNIYIPVLWPDALQYLENDAIESGYIRNILPLPVDQRYTSKDMEDIIAAIKDITK